MKPVAFAYCRPGSIAEACVELSRDSDARVLAGGQTRISLLAMRLARPTRRIDIARIGGIVLDRLPLRAKALPFVGHPATRHRATVGGSIANGDPASEIPLVAIGLGARIALKSASRAQAMAASDFYLANAHRSSLPHLAPGSCSFSPSERSRRRPRPRCLLGSAQLGPNLSALRAGGGPVAEPVGERGTL